MAVVHWHEGSRLGWAPLCVESVSLSLKSEEHVRLWTGTGTGTVRSTCCVTYTALPAPSSSSQDEWGDSAPTGIVCVRDLYDGYNKIQLRLFLSVLNPSNVSSGCSELVGQSTAPTSRNTSFACSANNWKEGMPVTTRQGHSVSPRFHGGFDRAPTC